MSASSAIVVAKLTKVGSPNPDAPGQAYYDDAEAIVIRTISWKVPGPKGGEIPGYTLTFSYTAQAMPAASAEQVPVEGEQYILFLQKKNGRFRAIKMLAATAENLDTVRAKH